MTSSAVTIYTDGACRGNPGSGGWDALLLFGEHRKELKGRTRHDQQANGIDGCDRGSAFAEAQLRSDAHTDSKYVRKGITEWIPQWQQRDWRTADRKPVKNVDLWQALEIEIAKHEIAWHWLKGHAGVPGNERADVLANDAIVVLLAG